ncbi:MAG TPA: hypothetical protein VEY07_08790 [Thermoplasmata archaeon]|nr:hypothetical protein [Thermoplasmata archaeon]
MPGLSRFSSWPKPEYVIHQTFRAPLRFVYDWCTDFTPSDAKWEGEKYERRILTRDPNRIVYEDVEWEGNGWFWARTDVRLRPPGRWQMESVGNRRLSRAEYALRTTRDGRTVLELRLRRKPSLVPAKKLSKRAREASVSRAWKNFARALESDYRRTLARRHRR